MVYLLDTCVIIDLIRGDTNTIEALKSKSPDLVAISTITEFELRYGLAKTPNLKTKSKRAVESLLQEVNLQNFESKEAKKAAEIRNKMKLLGTPIGPYDVLIAATALANDLILVTSNLGEFSRINELKIENWRDA
ncbi:MAG TPA: VapC toxin family PIN domain ribonuclease [Flavobacteriales bacterium]|jgi:tRNA(fMet)-specific endonuclease VapC|nr:VapC toxin family PIN domain ribonuclease [Flavobacteriales bacterium]